VAGEGFILLEGTRLENGTNLVIVNVYSPGELRNKKMLWEELKGRRGKHYELLVLSRRL